MFNINIEKLINIFSSIVTFDKIFPIFSPSLFEFQSERKRVLHFRNLQLKNNKKNINYFLEI